MARQTAEALEPPAPYLEVCLLGHLVGRRLVLKRLHRRIAGGAAHGGRGLGSSTARRPAGPR